MWEADAANKVLKARIRADRIEAWPQENSRIEAFFVAFSSHFMA